MEAKARPRVVCVDDEPHVAAGLALHLRRRYEVEIATSGKQGLELLSREPEAAVVISDMRMPQMSGAEFLERALASHPNTTRILLTGYAEVDAAIKAVNHGQVFRFLVKPCPPPELLKIVDAAAQQHQLVTVERDLLERTLHGSVKMLCEVLAISNPVGFGRASRIKQHVSRLLDELGETQRWQVEVAAMLSQLGSISLPDETAEKLYYGAALTPDEQRMVERTPDVSEQLLGHIPRLEAVRAILARRDEPFRSQAGAEPSAEEKVVRRGAQLLKVAADFDALEALGVVGTEAVETMKGRTDQYDPEILLAMQRTCGRRSNAGIREVSLAALKPGMVFASDVKMMTGTLFVARGYEVTESFLGRIRNFRPGSVKEPLRVLIRPDP